MKLSPVKASVLVACLLTTHAQPSPAGQSNPFAGKGKFADYAQSNNYDSFDPAALRNKVNLEYGVGRVPKILKKFKDSVQLEPLSAHSKLTIPLGWYAADTGTEAVIFSKDDATKITFAFANLKTTDFTQFKNDLLPKIQKMVHQPDAQFKQFDLPDGTVAIEVTNMKGRHGEPDATVMMFTPDPNSQKAGLAQTITMRTCQSDLAKNERMLGLILRSRKIDWQPIEQKYSVYGLTQGQLETLKKNNTP